MCPLQLWTQEATLGDAMLAMLQRLPKLKWMVTTRGKQGSVLLQRSAAAPDADTSALNNKLHDLSQQLADSDSSANPVACITDDNIYIRSVSIVLRRLSSATLPKGWVSTAYKASQQSLPCILRLKDRQT